MKQITVLKKGRIIDPKNNRDKQADLWLSDGKVVEPEDKSGKTVVEYDVSGCWVVPGLIDMHVHLREPGEEYKETIESGTQAAAAGGFTAVACMPNTKPVNDCESVTKFILKRAEGCAAHVYPVGSVSKGLGGAELAEYGEMKTAGVVALSDDGKPVVNSQFMRRALEYASSHGLPIISHSEERSMCVNGSMNEGLVSTRLGLKGIPPVSEAIMVNREIMLAELVESHIHIAHVSTGAAVRLIREAKARGVRVTAETAPHYFSLTDEAVEGYNTNAKMNPPLRSIDDVESVKEGLADGTIDAIATDHAPHSVLEKELEFDQAMNGIIGLESALPLSLKLVHDGLIPEERLVSLMSVNPAAILGVAGGNLQPGSPADVTVIDPAKQFIFTEEFIVSKGKNSPFLNWELTGRARMTFCGGRLTHQDPDQ